MCCLPLPLLKMFTGIGAAISALLSIAMLVAVIYVTFEHKDIIDSADEPVLKTLLVMFYIVSIVFLLLALCGLYGSIKAKRKNKLAPCLLSAYSISVIVFFFVFVALTIVVFAAPPAVFSDSCKVGGSTKLVQQLYNLSQNAYDKFCSTDCPCYLTPQNIDSQLANLLKTQQKVFNSDQKNSYRSYKKCLNSLQQQSNGLLLGSLQDFLQCGGWCQQQQYKYLRFSDINFCTTENCYTNKPACYDEFKNFMLSKGKTMGIATIIASLICFVNMVFICCICFHPTTRTQKYKNFYARMMDNNDD